METCSNRRCRAPLYSGAKKDIGVYPGKKAILVTEFNRILDLKPRFLFMG